jgi:hypothetical protein
MVLEITQSKGDNKNRIPKFELSNFISNFNAVFISPLPEGGGGSNRK